MFVHLLVIYSFALLFNFCCKFVCTLFKNSNVFNQCSLFIAVPCTDKAKSLVIKPASTVSIQTSSNVLHRRKNENKQTHRRKHVNKTTEKHPTKLHTRSAARAHHQTNSRCVHASVLHTSLTSRNEQVLDCCLIWHDEQDLESKRRLKHYKEPQRQNNHVSKTTIKTETTSRRQTSETYIGLVEVSLPF